jgi:NADH dehydrogenase
VPGIAPAAKQQGRYVAALIKARLRGGTLPPFRYKHAGSLAQIGKRKAVIDFGASSCAARWRGGSGASPTSIS